MCRLYGFRANELTKVECTLVRAQNALLTQSRQDLRGLSHPDGWGIAVYDEDGVPTVERHANAAHEDAHFSATAERIFSRSVVAHVRDATVGTASPFNTHPFSHGRWVFAHNGTIRGFDVLAPLLQKETEPHLLKERLGATDSEQAFLWLLSRMSKAGMALDRSPDVELLVSTLSRSIELLSKRCREVAPKSQERLNFLLTDGEVLVVSRWFNGLWYVDRRGVHDCEVCGIPHVHHSNAVEYRAIVAASEPISHEAWQEVPEGTILVVDRTMESYLVTI